MEIRAHYIMVGLFSLMLLFGGVIFALWMGSNDKRSAKVEYDIYITESVAGLSINNDVLFSGIRVGKVTDIDISPVTPGEVQVRVAIEDDTPVRENSVANLEITGITGVCVIAITGGTADSPLKTPPAGGVGTILYEPSPLSSVVAQVPDIFTASSRVLHRLELLVSDTNLKAVEDTLQSVATISGTLAERAKTLDGILADTEKLLRDIDTLTVNANEAMVTNVRATTRSMRRIAERVDSTMAMMEPGLKDFSTQGLAEMRMLMVELRGMTQVMTRVGEKLESDPGRFLFGEPVKEYKPQ